MTTNEEFKEAINMMIACLATVRCGCNMDEETGEFLKRICKHYIEAYEERFR